ncbi:hypothetical protein OZY43_02660 [Lactobacillus sp. ESL0785]|uniref:hypothetical protein n=1 Tax=Lactobacillus sp. ESL0785 TaxID=2983232 RepID=UPI0023F68C0A|nr:hypothetical protein [Lactobacillus sp. ESL0785]WEV71319.1 hypothetical protein OZY43_02660 [Lactobacillus sp. ESL0785]
MFILLLSTGILIVFASFSLVFSFDNTKSRHFRQLLFGISVVLFVIISLLIKLMMARPIG